MRASSLMPLRDFPAAQREAIDRAVALPDPPPRWLDLGLARIRSRAWAEWHLQRGIDPDRYYDPKPSLALRAAVLARDGLVCGICGGNVLAGDVHLDHVHPFARGGPTTLANLRVTHAACNIRKGVA